VRRRGPRSKEIKGEHACPRRTREKKLSRKGDRQGDVDSQDLR